MLIPKNKLFTADFSFNDRQRLLKHAERMKIQDNYKLSFLFLVSEACGWLLVITLCLFGAKAGFNYVDKADAQAKLVINQPYTKLYADTEQLMKGHEE